ncbi:two-partner secretion domain-containing protein [Planktothricoides raciborskii]|uniref:S-layer family protein n=1 Tax=Planktothricoides raciborskii FACHB-1370 TaxID=2949576 RepID=A0ABR8EC55_9CYAN|nr:S-layer family protein [Planktothricoides raciborskii]MBD2543748.1 S-layer family protein [Planktothricoides raciborskii FACHB-1370]MBD2582357.1 S-layer family protein [Planktothricoides raciborskii FACHB-1261]
MKLPRHLFPGLIVMLSGWVLPWQSSTAQILPDSTLPGNSLVTPNGQIWEITGGTQAGGNLFHSFEKFSILTGETAFFNHSLDIQNIFSRVTGGSASEIDGLIRANGTANLFLLNPNGIMFGPNARLDIGGSFFASTADRINFAGGGFFSATDPEASPVLTINVPIGLQFGASPGAISNQSRVSSNSNEQTVGLQVQPGKTLALVGGNVTLDGGYITAPGGRIELGSLGEPGTVGLNQDGSLSFPDAIARGDILLTNGAEVNVRAATGGDIAIHGGNFELLQGSTVKAGIALGLGSVDSQAGDIEINATGNVSISNTGSFISNAVLWDAIGNSGDVNITANSLSVTNGGQISASTRGQGNVGDVNINVRDTASFDGLDNDFISSNASNVVYGVGQAGDINITAASLSVTNGARLEASTFGQGNAGNVNINVRDTVSFSGYGGQDSLSGVYSRAETIETVGDGGKINITAGSLFVTDGAVVTASTAGQGNANDIAINVRDRIVLGGLGPFDPVIRGQQSSGIFSTVKETGVGNGGNVRITTGSLLLVNSGIIVARTIGQGNAGNIWIDAAESVMLSGVGEDLSSSGLFTNTEESASGRGGDITVNTDVFRVSGGAVANSQTLNASAGGDITINARIFEAIDGGQVLASTANSGQAGSLTINATEQIFLSGRDPNFAQRVLLFKDVFGNNEAEFSGIFANTREESTGPGGTLTLQTRQLTVRDTGTLSVTAAGVGAAGSLIIDASLIRLENGSLTAETSQGDFGDIRIQSSDIQLRENSRITTNAGSATGGNISINTDTLAALENSDITANALAGFGGLVTINAQGIFATEFRETLSSASDITATSELGPQFSGTVEINTPDTDPTSGLLKLPQTPVDVTSLVDRRCTPSNPQQSSFINIGRGGKPATPRDPLSSNGGWVDSNFSEVSTTASVPTDKKPGFSSAILAESQERLTETRFLMPHNAIVEAQGWIFNEQGQIILVGQTDAATPDRFLPTPRCGE